MILACTTMRQESQTIRCPVCNVRVRAFEKIEQDGHSRTGTAVARRRDGVYTREFLVRTAQQRNKCRKDFVTTEFSRIGGIVQGLCVLLSYVA